MLPLLQHILHPFFLFPFFFCCTFLFWESSNLWRPLLMMIAIYHQMKTLIDFWCIWRLNPRSLIQPSETLPIELTGTYLIAYFLFSFFIMFSIYPSPPPHKKRKKKNLDASLEKFTCLLKAKNDDFFFFFWKGGYSFN